MGYTHGTPSSAKYKVCTYCGEELPNTNEYFGWASKNDNRLSARCKQCQKEINKIKREKVIENNKNLTLIYDGTRKCIKCNRELPNDKFHFPIDLSCKDGLRNVCRECNPKDSGFLSPDYVLSEKWTKEEDEIMFANYKDYTGIELHELFLPNRSVRAIESRAGVLGISGKSEETDRRAREKVAKITSEKLKGVPKNPESVEKQRLSILEHYKTHTSYWKGRKRSEEQRKMISERMKGHWSGESNPRHINPLNGSANGRWKGGILDVYTELRSDTKDWQHESMIFCNYSCVITNINFDNTHHTTPFRNIVDECFEITKLDVRQKVKDYSEDEFNLLRNTLKELHIMYGLGACLCKDVHKLFHDNYGYTNFTPQDFLDFVYKIDCGEFDEWFTEKDLEININYEYINYLESTLIELKSA